MSFDPMTKAFKVYPVPQRRALPAHGARRQGRHRLVHHRRRRTRSAASIRRPRHMTVMRLPHNGFWRWVSDMLFPTLLRIAPWFPDKRLLVDFSHHRFFGFRDHGVPVRHRRQSEGRQHLVRQALREQDRPHRSEDDGGQSSSTRRCSGPRRPRFDADGILWIPAFDEGGLMRFDTATRRFESYQAPGRGRRASTRRRTR